VNPCAHHHPADALAAFAADAIDDPGERRAIEGHLAHCPACRDHLETHERVLASLVEDEAPPATLWDAIAARVARPSLAAVPSAPATRANGSAAGVPAGLTATPLGAPPAGPAPAPGAPARPAPVNGAAAGPPLQDAAARPGSLDGARAAASPLGTPPARPLRLVGSVRPSAAPPGPRRRGGERRRPRRLGLVAAAAALVAAAAAAPLAVTAFHRSGSGTQVSAARTAAVLDDVTGRDMARVVDRGGATYVVLGDLPPLPADRTYQLWSLDGARPASLGVIGRGAARTVPVTLPPGTRRLAISDEPAGGSPEPTTAIAGTGRLS
jgi:anti-sigma-K factor RskA